MRIPVTHNKPSLPYCAYDTADIISETYVISLYGSIEGDELYITAPHHYRCDIHPGSVHASIRSLERLTDGLSRIKPASVNICFCDSEYDDYVSPLRRDVRGDFLRFVLKVLSYCGGTA